MSSITDLPDEILSKIIARINTTTHTALFLTCKYLYNKSQNRVFLENLFMFRMKIFKRSLSYLNEREILHVYSLEKDYKDHCKGSEIEERYDDLLKIFSENGYNEFVIHFISNENFFSYLR